MTHQQKQSAQSVPVTPATPPVAVWITRWTAPLVGLAPPEECQPLRPWRSGQLGGRPRCAGHQPRATRSRPHRTPQAKPTPRLVARPSAPFGRRPAGHAPAASPFPQGRCHVPCFSSAALPLRSGKDKVRITTPSGCRESQVLLRVQCCPRPSHSVDALSRKSVREHLQSGWAARRWQSLVGVRWQRWQCRVAAFYFQRVSLPVQWWRAAGCPPAFRPRLPWWQPLVWRWLVLSGWQR